MKQALQAAMTRWGRPERMRFDNGSPWGTHSAIPSALALWLVGLGITPVFGRPARSTDNAVVERSHGVLAKWVEPKQCANLTICAERLAWAVHTQRERYPLTDHLPRCTRYPALATNPHRYDPLTELSDWQMTRVVTYLAHFHFQRKVETSGQFTLFANTYSVGRAHARQSVDVCLDPRSLEWVVSDEYGKELRRLPNQELTYSQIAHLQLAKRRKATETL